MLNVSAFSSPNQGAQLQAFFREEMDCESSLRSSDGEKGAKRR
jgi:hypothetical protein